MAASHPYHGIVTPTPITPQMVTYHPHASPAYQGMAPGGQIVVVNRVLPAKVVANPADGSRASPSAYPGCPVVWTGPGHPQSSSSAVRPR